MSRIVAFPYYGGKTIHLSWLLPLLPMTPCYVEPFGGSAAVLLNRDPSPSEVYNDLSNTVVNFFRVIRQNRQELIEQLRATPYSREEFQECERFIKSGKDNPEVLTANPIEWARSFVVMIRQSFMANRRDWVASGIERGRLSAWLGGISGLDEIFDRLRNVQIENQDALTLIKRFDHPDVLMYQDPPYLLSTRDDFRVYEHEMEEEQHIALAEFNLKSKAKIAISGYKSDLYTELYEDNDWYLVKQDYVIGGLGELGARTECLWCNYDPKNVRIGNQTGIDQFWEVFK